MKEKITRLWMLVAMLLTILPASAYDFEVDGIYYNVVSLEDLTCEVTHGESGEKYEGDVVIPAEVTYNNRTLRVIAIGEHAFSFCYSMTSVTIPDSVTEIGYWAFYSCDSMTSVTIPDSVREIGEDAFHDCSSLTSVTIGDSVTIIGQAAFESCKSLTSVTLPDSLMEIGNCAFAYCNSLTSVTIPDSVTRIGSGAFKECSSLTSVAIPDLVGYIDWGTFQGCSSLTSITIPDSVKRINSSAFQGCSSLTSITIPDSVTEIDTYAFAGCSNLKSITLSNNLIGIEYGTFEGCKSLLSLSIPGSVERIVQYYKDVFHPEHYTFKECNKLKEVSFEYGEPKLEIGYYGRDYTFSHIGFITSGLDSWADNIEKIFIDREMSPNLYCKSSSLKKLIVGNHLTYLPLQYSMIYKLESIVVYAMTPPEVSFDFSDFTYMNAELMVPFEAMEAYQAHEVWGKFWNLQGFSGIDDVENGPVEKTVTGRYDLNGKPVTDDYKGISIVRFSDGSAKKVIL